MIMYEMHCWKSGWRMEQKGVWLFVASESMCDRLWDWRQRHAGCGTLTGSGFKWALQAPSIILDAMIVLILCSVSHVWTTSGGGTRNPKTLQAGGIWVTVLHSTFSLMLWPEFWVRVLGICGLNLGDYYTQWVALTLTSFSLKPCSLVKRS